MDVQETHLDPRLTLTLSATFSGCSGAGKTQLAQYILRHQPELLREQWTRILWLARYGQPSLEAALAGLPVEFRLVDASIPDLGELTAASGPPGQRTLIVLDDLMCAASGDEQISRLFTAGRHLGLSVFYMTQNLFCPGRFVRTIRLNTNFLFLFKSLHDSRQVGYYFQQMCHDNWREIVAAHRDATAAAYGYLMVNFRVATDPLLRFRPDVRADRQTLYPIEL